MMRAVRRLYAVVTGLVVLAIWWALSALQVFPTATIPAPLDVARAFGEELGSGRLLDDVVASLYRVGFGFVLAVITAVPFGLLLGRWEPARHAFLPWVNFLRSLSPIAWIPFAIVWFGIGDHPAMFIIYLATASQLALATCAAAMAVPRVYYKVAADLGFTRVETLTRVTLPAIMPQLSTALRVSIGVAWMVLVAGEMMAVRSGLGFLINDARYALRTDLVAVGMITVGAIGIGLDALFARIARIPSVRWGFDR